MNYLFLMHFSRIVANAFENNIFNLEPFKEKRTDKFIIFTSKPAEM